MENCAIRSFYSWRVRLSKEVTSVFIATLNKHNNPLLECRGTPKEVYKFTGNPSYGNYDKLGKITFLPLLIA